MSRLSAVKEAIDLALLILFGPGGEVPKRKKWHMVKIPKRLGHIWIGHLPPPEEWMQSWRDHHPDWDYTLFDNDYLFSRRWINQDLINEFYRRREYCGVSDLMRYELLGEFGGFIPEADSICLKPTDELWKHEALYTVYESEQYKPNNVSPFLASVPSHPYLDVILAKIRERNSPENLKSAWQSVGNRFLKFTLHSHPPTHGKLVIFPSHFFIPKHKKAPRYDGDGPVYCEQIWGSTFGRYKSATGIDVDKVHQEHMERLLQW